MTGDYMKKIILGLLSLFLLFGLTGVVNATDLLPVTVNSLGRPDLVGTITTDGASVIFNIRAVGQANDGDDINPSRYYSQTNFDNEYFLIYANGELLKYNMFMGNTEPVWGPGWSDNNPLPDGVTFSQTEDEDDFVYAVSMPYAALGVSEGDTFSVKIKARDFNDDYVQSYSGYEGYDGQYSQYRGLWITDTGNFDVTIPSPPLCVDDDGMCEIGDCDSTTSAYSVIQDAIDAATAGDTIHVCPGSYKGSDITKSVKIVASSGAKIDCSLGGPTPSGFQLQWADTTGVTIDGFEITNCVSAIVFSGGFTHNSVEIKNCNIHNNKNWGIYVHNGLINGLTVDNVIIKDNINSGYSGVHVNHLAAINDLTISNSEFSNNKGFGFVSYGTLNNAVLDTVIIQNNKGSGLGLTGTANDVTITGCTFSGNAWEEIDLEFWGKGLTTSNIVITNNNFLTNSAWTNIYIGPKASFSAGNIQINYNNFFKPWSWGVQNNAPTKVDALYNWWARQQGPGGSGSYQKNTYYDPWLCSEAPGGAIAYDNDEDGFRCNDCNDNDATVYPGAPELCDGKDNNCDGKVDEGCPQVNKQDALETLQGLSADKHSQKEIDKAIKHIEESLDDNLWVDYTHLNPKHGNKVFDEEKKAVKALMKVIDEGKKKPKKHYDEKIVDDVKEVIGLLVAADKVLAETVLEDAQANADDKKADKEIEKAEKELTKAAEELAKDKSDKAIDHYKKAWEHAQHAIKHATKS
jgi:hypothetical protein